MVAGTAITAYLWKKWEMQVEISLLVLALSTIAGFVFLTPLMPIEFTGLVSLLTGSRTLTLGLIGILIVIGLAVIYGRTFCGHICPVGTIQELASQLPGKKVDIKNPKIPELIRFGVFIAVVIAGLSSLTLMEYTGLYNFFSLTMSAGFILFAIILGISLFVYRPVCRFLCPYGLIFSLANFRSRYTITRTKHCIDCRKCEKACPVHIAGLDAPKRECYLCGRCKDACPVQDALTYDEQ
jgi:polyferredoxin